METADAIACTLNGQTEAFEALVIRYQKPIFKFLLGLGINSAALEDVAQEAFLSAYIHLKSFDANKSQFSTWLFTIAKNKAINHMRKKTLKSFFGFYNESIEKLIPETVVDGELEEQQRNDHILKAMSELSKDHRTVCVLYFFNELTIEQIAEIERCSLGTVKSRLFRAKQILKEHLKGSFYEYQ